MSGGYVSWHSHIIILSELDVLTESTILVWLCRRYSAEWVLGCLELGIISTVCCLLVLTGVMSFTLIRLCQHSIKHVYGGISNSSGQVADSSGGNIQVLGDIPQEAIETGGRIDPQSQLEEIGTVAALGWETIGTVSIDDSRQLTIEEEYSPRVSSATTTTVLRRSVRHSRRRNLSRVR